MSAEIRSEVHINSNVHSVTSPDGRKLTIEERNKRAQLRLVLPDEEQRRREQLNPIEIAQKLRDSLRSVTVVILLSFSYMHNRLMHYICIRSMNDEVKSILSNL